MKSILVVDDHRLIFDGLRAILEGYLFRHAETIGEAKRALAEQKISFCVVDISLKGESGLELLRELPRTIYAYVLTMHKSSELIAAARSLGARGYFLKDESLNSLLEAIKSPLRRDFWMSAELRAWLDKAEKPVSPLAVLTQRELQIFVLLAEGRSYREIAERLHISPKTVNVHKENIMNKLNLQSTIELVKLSSNLGLTVE